MTIATAKSEYQSAQISALRTSEHQWRPRQQEHPVSDIHAWHFIHAHRRLDCDDGRLVVPDETLNLYTRGPHASLCPLDALPYLGSQGAVICRVVVGGALIFGDDKLVGTSRKCLWMVDADRLLHGFSADAAEWALEQELSAGRGVHHDSWAAVEAKRGWVHGDVTDQELSAAECAAWSAAWSATRSAAWSAQSAQSSAWSAAESAARSAAWSARSSAWSAARSAAESAARSAQSARSSARSVLSWYLVDAAIAKAKSQGVWVPDEAA